METTRRRRAGREKGVHTEGVRIPSPRGGLSLWREARRTTWMLGEGAALVTPVLDAERTGWTRGLPPTTDEQGLDVSSRPGFLIVSVGHPS